MVRFQSFNDGTKGQPISFRLSAKLMKLNLKCQIERLQKFSIANTLARNFTLKTLKLIGFIPNACSLDFTEIRPF